MAIEKGDGFALGNIEDIGEGYGFRKVRRELDVTAFGVNVLVLPRDLETGFHFHDEQEELYFVHQGEAEFEFGDGSKHRAGPGTIVRVDPATHRKFSNVGDGDLVLLVTGGRDGYVGRDGRLPEGEQRVPGPH